MLAMRTAPFLFLALSPFLLSGCAICTNCEDEAYPSYGGIWQRTDRFDGRVGSVFAPAGAKVATAETVSDASPQRWEDDAEEDYETLPPDTVSPDGMVPEATAPLGPEDDGEGEMPEETGQLEAVDVEFPTPGSFGP